MSNLRLHWPDAKAALPALTPAPLGRHLVDAGVIAGRDLVHALELQAHVDAPLGEILISEGLASRADVLKRLKYTREILARMISNHPR